MVECGLSIVDDEWTPLIEQLPIPNDHHGDGNQDQQPRGGKVWGEDSAKLFIHHLPVLNQEQSPLNNRGNSAVNNAENCFIV